MVERLAVRFGTTPMRLLVVGWVVSAVLLLGGLALVLTGASTAAGFVVFIVGGWYLFKTFEPGLMLVAIPAWILGAMLTVFEGLIQFLQAYVFTLLAASYIGGALADEH